MIVTPELFDRIRTVGACLPQTVIGPAKALVVMVLSIDDLDIVDVPWLCLHATQLSGIIRNSDIITASKPAGSPVTLTSSEAFFSSKDVGSLITWTTGEQTYISAYLSPTSVTVTNISGLTNPAGLISGYFSIQPTTPDVVNTAIGHVACGLVSTSPELFDQPGGCMESSISISSVGVVAAPSFIPRRYSGTDKLAIVVVNNTRNFNITAVVTAAARCTQGL